jgi:hypothetical protein
MRHVKNGNGRRLPQAPLLNRRRGLHPDNSAHTTFSHAPQLHAGRSHARIIVLYSIHAPRLLGFSMVAIAELAPALQKFSRR